jgi:hypothetical protein
MRKPDFPSLWSRAPTCVDSENVRLVPIEAFLPRYLRICDRRSLLSCQDFS